MHLPGVGQKTEIRLQESGLADWQDLLDRPPEWFVAKASKDVFYALEKSIQALESLDAAYLAAVLPARERWRLYWDFRDSVCFLDIETTGAKFGDPLTVVGLWAEGEMRQFVKGENLEDFPYAFERFRLVVTYCGAGFDLPVLEKRYGRKFRPGHLDLMPALARLGCKGGLKGCERAYGLFRGPIDGLDGLGATLLWQDWLKNGNSRALKALLAYNAYDAANLEYLAVAAHNQYLGESPDSQPYRLDPPPIYAPQVYVDKGLIERVKAEAANIRWR